MIGKIVSRIKRRLGCSRRENIFKILPKHSVCAELGVFRGDFSKLILRYAEPKEAHFVDVWWLAFGEYYPDWGSYTNHGKLKTRIVYAEAEAKIKAFPGKHVIHVGSDLEYLQTIPDQYFDWVYSHEYANTNIPGRNCNCCVRR